MIILAVLFAGFVFVSDARAENAEGVVAETGSRLGVIKGVVRDDAGKPIARATVAIFKVGTSRLLKQVRSAKDGSFLTKILPGTYSILAVAEGFNPVSLAKVEVNTSAELVYRFKLEPSGRGNTLPEKRADRKSSKYPIRSAQVRRSIYQIEEGDNPLDTLNEDSLASGTVEQSVEIPAAADDAERERRPVQTVVETYFAGSEGEEGYTGINFATLLPVADNAEIVLAGQTGTGAGAPNRFEANVKIRPNKDHQIQVRGSVSRFGQIRTGLTQEDLSQFSLQVLDEWKIREGIILVYGFDYSRFMGAGSDFSVSPRVGFQFDVNSRTRVRTAYTTQTEQPNWQQAIALENTQVLFREPVSMQDIFIEDGTPQMNKSRRFEFGVERVLDNRSSVEANVFFDTVAGRGVGLTNIPLDGLNSAGFGEIVANQQGKAQGFRVVYARRLSGIFSASVGYAFGNGQRLSDDGLSNPSNLFENDFFQTFVGEFDADLSTGTSVRTIFRLSPEATVFAIDPFAGRMAIYDPSLSVLVTQSLPSWGLPIHAEAIIDARNLLDFQSTINGEEGMLRLISRRRMVRGGISLRF